MGIKQAISQGYLERQNDAHGAKLRPNNIRALITGDGKKGSIGAAIRLLFKDAGLEIESFQADVRNDCLYIDKNMMLNTLIMCHGYTHLDWFEDAPLEEMKRIIDVNLFGTINVTQAFVKATIGNPTRKNIISIGSMAYKAVLNGSSAYCASKAGAAHLMKCLAWELAPKGYDIFTIHPSNTAGAPMTEDTIKGLMRYRNMSRGEAESYWGDSPIRNEILEPQEIADLVLSLLTGTPYLSGCQLELAGGMR